MLVPELSYAGLEIQKGDVAQLKYQELINLPEKNIGQKKIKVSILEYCKLDTLAMVHILTNLERIV